MKIESLKVKNFKSLRDVEIKDIPNFCVIVGANGTGKTTLFKIFEFLSEAFNSNVQTALIKQGGAKGFNEVKSRNAPENENIEIEIQFRSDDVKTTTGHAPLITYILHIGQTNNQAFVVKEILKYRRGKRGQPLEFLNFSNGNGFAVTNEELNNLDKEEQLEKENHTLKANNILAIKGLAQFEKFPAVNALGDLIEYWHLSDIHINQARDKKDAGFAEHLSREGENLSSVIDYLHNNHPQIVQTIIEKLKHRIPGITDVKTYLTETGEMLLKIQDKAFDEPFLVKYVSDGTIKMLAYLILLYDPKPHPLLCVEEPENQLYQSLLGELAEEFRAYALRGGQVFVSTHSPDFLNAIELEEVFMLIKENGYTSIKRARDDRQLKVYMNDGSKMGALWKEGFFTGVDPE